MSLQTWGCRAALSLALLFGGVVFAAAEQRAPSGRAVMAWHVTIAPSWFDPSTRAAADHAVRHAVRDPRRAGAALSRPEDGPEPRRIVDRERGRPDLRVQAAPEPEVPQRRPADDRGRQVQLRALQGRRRQDPARTRHAGGDRRSARRALPSEGAVARLHDLLRHDRQRRRHRRAEEVPAPRSATTASRSTRSAPAPTSSSAPSRASRSCSRPSPTTGGACRT